MLRANFNHGNIMIYHALSGSDLKVSKICLGSMTWGQQNTAADAFAQLDYATAQGINFIDTAELYAVPVRPETYGHTEKILGQWLAKNRRQDLVITSKAAGPGAHVGHIRQGPKFTHEHLKSALEGSLQRLQTDYLDIYLLHWPERHSPRFGALNYEHRPEIAFEDFAQILQSMQQFIAEGKIRYFGVSNETAWGLMKYLQLSSLKDLPKCVCIQNPYSLICRTYELGLSEIGLQEGVDLCAYSPLGGGLLSGKYNHGDFPAEARFGLFPNYFGRYKHPNTLLACQAYEQLAQDHGLDMAQMALAYVQQKDFVGSNIIGATTMAQLKTNIESIDLQLPDAVRQGIEAIHLRYPNPAP
jgi:aryl-alcohol dehydrogenase-like predicted oxidoreductase